MPYFEVDLDDAGGLTTLVAVGNVSPATELARVILWTDAAVPTLTVYLLLSPFDVQTLNLRDVLAGRLPDTGHLLDGTAHEACSPAHFSASLTAQQVQSLRADHTGKQNLVQDGRCGGFDHGDAVARGYLTIDHVTDCTYPPTVTTWTLPPGGFHLYRAALDRENVLWGDFFVVTPGQNFAQGDRLVHVPWDGARIEDTAQSFYGSSLGFDGADGRLPLPSEFLGRFIDGGPFDGGTDFFVWRDTRSGAFERFQCGTSPSWAPLRSPPIEVFDEAENSVVLPGGLDQLCLGGAAPAALRCRVVVPPGLGTISGFVLFDLWHAPLNLPAVPAQGWVAAVMNAEGRFSLGFDTIPLDDGCELPRAVP